MKISILFHEAMCKFEVVKESDVLEITVTICTVCAVHAVSYYLAVHCTALYFHLLPGGI